MSRRLGPLIDLASAGIAGVSTRARWSFVDQVLISGVNFLVGVLLVRALGVQAFGVYSLVMIGVYFLAGIQLAGILGPMMSLYDQRADVSQSNYLATMLVHQLLFSALTICVLLILWLVLVLLGVATPIDMGLAAALLVSSQFQDLSRRFFYVTERSARAFVGDLIAYGLRLMMIAALAFGDLLTLNLVWATMIGTCAAGFLLIVPEMLTLDWSREALSAVTRAHRKIAGWMVGNAILTWFSENGYVLITIAVTVGAEQLGALRAIQNLILVVNLLLLALENVVPSSASKHLQAGGADALLRYLTRVSFAGVAGIAAFSVLMMMFADPILFLVYQRTFPDQLAIIAISGALYAVGHVMAILFSGLRALGLMQAAFWSQVLIYAVAMPIAWYVSSIWGVVGALSMLLVIRLALTTQLALLVRRRAGGASLGEQSAGTE